ncbi:MAG: DUF3786 domain-containing protein [Deltaproteobacteria bacterium]|nr:DUF3786 domain-containing protein [Deltaproteobacteria bacterium]
MATGACGINCNICRLHLLGICSTCGSGRSTTAKKKLDAQKRLFGRACAVLECAVLRGIHYCMRDCDDFPCDNFRDLEYPFSEAFLDMQARRRNEAGASGKQAAWPEATPEFWERLKAMDPPSVAARTGCIVVQETKYRVRCLNETWIVDPGKETIVKEDDSFGGEWDRQMPFLILAYLVLARQGSLSGEMVSPRDLGKGQDYFRGHAQIDLKDIEHVFGSDTGRFLAAAESLDGRSIEIGDAGAHFHIFPKLPIQIILWSGDDEFPPRAHVLLDRSTFDNYPAEGIANVINLLAGRLTMGASEDNI